MLSSLTYGHQGDWNPVERRHGKAISSLLDGTVTGTTLPSTLTTTTIFLGSWQQRQLAVRQYLHLDYLSIYYVLL